MNLRLLSFVMLLLASISMWAIKPTESAHQLAVRLMGEEKARQISFKQIKSDKDIFTLKTQGSKIVIYGNNANSMSMGLGHYLKYYCHTYVSWDNADKVALPSELPKVDNPVTREARVKNRFFLNYCTFGYTMVWWQWQEWERFIDWMALNGINLPLAITGQESVWYKVWRQLGLTDEEVRSYFTGPAHLPWHRMINLDHWQGPLPVSWLECQEKLQKQIVERERQLGMKPVLPAFAGHVPEALKRVYPDAKISRMSSWGGFRDEFRSFFLDPNDPLFEVIQKAFMEEQTRLYGTDHIYGVDPFNEVDPPSWEPTFLAEAGKTIYNSLTNNDPDAVWVQMTWLFYIDSSHWTQPRISAFLSAVPKHRLILLDYFAENTEVWQRTESYYGQDFVWCYLGNFGGNTMLAGNLKETGKRIEYALKNASDNMNGVGSTLEGFDCNPLMYEYVLDKAWTPLYTDEEWVRQWAVRRAGSYNKNNEEAWQLLLDNVYTRPAALGQAPLVNSRPSLKGHGNWTTNPTYHYDNKVLLDVWGKMLEAAISSEGLTDAQKFDLVNVGRQYLSNDFMRQRNEFTSAFEANDSERLVEIGNGMKQTLADIEVVLSMHPYFSYDRWISNAVKFAANDAEKAYYRQNAATLLTTWGETPQSLNDYASRTWSGLTAHYYAARWCAFIDEVISASKKHEPFNQSAFNTRMYDFERTFVNSDIRFETQMSADPLKEMRRVYDSVKSR